MHPERELRTAGALYESETAFRDMFASHVVVDGTLVTGEGVCDYSGTRAEPPLRDAPGVR